MSNFFLFISKSKTDMGDNVIHLKEEGKPQKRVAYIQFADLPFLNESVIDELLESMARKLASRIITHRACGDESPEMTPLQNTDSIIATKEILKSLGMPPATSEGYNKWEVLIMEDKVIKTCSTCVHAKGSKCMASGLYMEVERRCNTKCSAEFSAWVQRPSVKQRMVNFLWGLFT